MNTSQATYDRLKAMQRAEEAAAAMAKRVSDRIQKPRSHDERVRDATASHMAELQAKLKSGLLLPAEREQLKRRLDILKAGHAEAGAKVDEAKRIEKFRSDHAYQNAKTHFEAFSKAPAAPVSVEDIALCGAILSSTEWANPADAVSAYWREVERVEQAAYEQASSKSADSQHAAIKADRDAAKDALAAKEREQAVAQARANAGGGHE